MDIKRRYREKSIKWVLCNEDFSDLNAKEIAEVLNTNEKVINTSICKIKKDTGFIVPRRYERKYKT